MNTLEHEWLVWNKPSIAESNQHSDSFFRRYLYLNLEAENCLETHGNLIIISVPMRGFRTVIFKIFS